jgi:hypothetical protein
MQERLIVGSSAQTVSGVSPAVEALGRSPIFIELNITAASGTTPTLVVSLEWTNANGVWYSADPVDQMTSRSTPGAWVKQFTSKGDRYRVRWTIGGTTPSFTFEIAEAIN